MTLYECDECGTAYTSPAAMMHCCQERDRYGYPIPVKGGDWIP